MTYSDVAALAADPDFAARTQACYATETLNVEGADSPGGWQPAHAWDMAAQPGFGDAYAGGGSEAVTDPMILSAVQGLLNTP